MLGFANRVLAIDIGLRDIVELGFFPNFDLVESQGLAVDDFSGVKRGACCDFQLCRRHTKYVLCDKTSRLEKLRVGAVRMRLPTILKEIDLEGRIGLVLSRVFCSRRTESPGQHRLGRSSD